MLLSLDLYLKKRRSTKGISDYFNTFFRWMIVPFPVYQADISPISSNFYLAMASLLHGVIL